MSTRPGCARDEGKTRLFCDGVHGREWRDAEREGDDAGVDDAEVRGTVYLEVGGDDAWAGRARVRASQRRGIEWNGTDAPPRFSGASAAVPVCVCMRSDGSPGARMEWKGGRTHRSGAVSSGERRNCVSTGSRSRGREGAHDRVAADVGSPVVERLDGCLVGHVRALDERGHGRRLHPFARPRGCDGVDRDVCGVHREGISARRGGSMKGGGLPNSCVR